MPRKKLLVLKELLLRSIESCALQEPGIWVSILSDKTHMLKYCLQSKSPLQIITSLVCTKNFFCFVNCIVELLEAWPETPELFALKIWKDKHFNYLHFPLLFMDLTTHVPNKFQIICSSDSHNVPFWAKSHSSNAIIPRPANKYTFNVSYNQITAKAINQLQFSNNTHFSHLE